jgi:hypothetical protein
MEWRPSLKLHWNQSEWNQIVVAYMQYQWVRYEVKEFLLGDCSFGKTKLRKIKLVITTSILGIVHYPALYLKLN